MGRSSPDLCAVLVIAAITLCSSLIAVETPPASPPANETTTERNTDATADAAVLNLKTRQQVKVDGTQDQYEVVDSSAQWIPTKTAIVIIDM